MSGFATIVPIDAGYKGSPRKVIAAPPHLCSQLAPLSKPRTPFRMSLSNVGPSFELTYGAMLVGDMIAMWYVLMNSKRDRILFLFSLYGGVFMQSVLYFQKFDRRDGWKMNATVSAVWFVYSVKLECSTNADSSPCLQVSRNSAYLS